MGVSVCMCMRVLYVKIVGFIYNNILPMYLHRYQKEKKTNWLKLFVINRTCWRNLQRGRLVRSTHWP